MPTKKLQPSQRVLQLDRQVMQIKDQVRRDWLHMGRVLSELQLSLAYRELGSPKLDERLQAE